MIEIKKHLKKLTCIIRPKHTPLVYKIHEKYGVSKKTLFYVKEYGPHSHVIKNILKESFKVLLFSSILSSIGGLMIEQVKHVFISFLPLIILLPALNDMFGDYGIVISSKFSTMLHEGEIGKKWWRNKKLMKLIMQVLIVSVIMVFLSSLASFGITILSGYELTFTSAYRILSIMLLDVVLLLIILILTAIFAGIYFFKKQEDPNNFLIPITTSVADFGNMILLSILVILFL